MHWRLKTHVQNVVARLPWSDAVYYALQRAAGSLRQGTHDPSPWYTAAREMADWVRAATGQDISGRRFVEIGTGRRVDLPTGLWLLGAESIVTVDVNRYLTGELVRESVRWVRGHPRTVARVFGPHTDTACFRERHARLLAAPEDLVEYLAMIASRYAAPLTTRLPVDDHSVDFHVSHVVLQHVRHEELAALLAEARRVLRPGGLFVHFIDTSDTCSHGDPSVPAVHFLRFSADEWRSIGGNRFNYQNRFRPSDYLEHFRRAGLQVMEVHTIIDTRSRALLESGELPASTEFAGKSLDDLAASHLRVLARFDS